MRVEIDEETGRIKKEFNHVYARRSKAVKALLREENPELALQLIKGSNDPSEIRTIVGKFNRDKHDNSGELIKHRNNEMVIAAIGNDSQKSRTSLYSHYFEHDNSLLPPTPLDSPEVRAAFLKKYESIPAATEQYELNYERNTKKAIDEAFNSYNTNTERKNRSEMLYNLGGSYWTKGDDRRYYFDPKELLEAFGGKHERLSNDYGNVEIGDESFNFHNSDFPSAYYDLNTNEWQFWTKSERLYEFLHKHADKIELPD